MTITQQQFVQLLAFSICGRAIPDGFTIDDPQELLLLAKSQEVGQLTAWAVEKSRLFDSEPAVAEQFRQQYYRAFLAVTIMESELTGIKNALEKNGIDYIPLKGAFLRRLYPEPWMRVSGDLDILVREKELTLAERVLTEAADCRLGLEGAHHDHVRTPGGITIDLHFILTEREEKAKPILDQVWSHAKPVAEGRHEYVMDDEYFYLFHMFHAKNHFVWGGCGVRTLLDTWLLNHRLIFDREKRYALLDKADLLPFAKSLEELGEQWLSGKENDAYADVGDYILNGDVFGREQRVEALRAERGSWFRFILFRAFPPYERMKPKYPILKQGKIFLPFCWIYRLIVGLFIGKLKKAGGEIRRSQSHNARSKEIAEMFRKLGL